MGKVCLSFFIGKIFKVRHDPIQKWVGFFCNIKFRSFVLWVFKLSGSSTDGYMGVPWKHVFAGSNPAYQTITGCERVVDATGLGSQWRHKGVVVRGFEPHHPDNTVIVEELVDSPDCESGIIAGSSPVFHPKGGSQNNPCKPLGIKMFFEILAVN